MAATPKKKVIKPISDEPKYLCPYCNREKKKADFYTSTDPLVLTGITCMCKLCAERIARNWSPASKTYIGETKASVQEALERLDKPYFDEVWNYSYHEAQSSNSKLTIWGSYIKQMHLSQYKGLRWRDGDIFDRYKIKAEQEMDFKNYITQTSPEDEEIKLAYETNRRDVLRMVGYDPFLNYPLESDKPVLYAQLVNFIDDETKEDGMKMNAVIQIVQAFNQIQKINDAINEMSADVMKITNNNGTIKQLADTTTKLLSGANALAKDNGISVNNNRSKSKGADTLTGKMRELELIGFRNEKINAYDIDYCRGMRQVAEISAKAQIDQIGFDENVMNEVQNIRRELVDTLQAERDKAVERARILLVENRDLKDFLREKGFLDANGEVIYDG